jgi:glutamate carboxypeptidase
VSGGLDARETRLAASLAARAPAIEADLAALVAIPTGHGFAPGLDETRGRLTQRLARLGGRTELVPGDAAPDWLSPAPAASPAPPPPTAIVRGPETSGRSVLVAAHLDTVHDPHGNFRTLVREGAIARGPGAADLKGGIALLLHALEAIAEGGLAVRWTVLLNSDEETGSYASAACLAAEARRHEIGLAVEPATAAGGLVVERMGAGQFRVDVRGRSAHVGRDFTAGVSAVNELARKLLEIERLSRPAEGRIASVGPLRGGAVSNAVPDSASAWGNVRFRDPTAEAELAAALDALATAPDAMPAVRVRRSFLRPAKPRRPATLAMAEGIRAVSESLGLPLPFESTGGVCDGNNLEAAGLPTLDTLGVRGGNLHRTDEFVELATLPARAALLAITLLRASEGRLS